MELTKVDIRTIGFAMLQRLQSYVDRAITDMEALPKAEGEIVWARVVGNAQALLDAMPDEPGMESILTVYTFLCALEGQVILKAIEELGSPN
jgi:hypothetical protein